MIPPAASAVPQSYFSNVDVGLYLCAWKNNESGTGTPLAAEGQQARTLNPWDPSLKTQARSRLPAQNLSVLLGCGTYTCVIITQRSRLPTPYAPYPPLPRFPPSPSALSTRTLNKWRQHLHRKCSYHHPTDWTPPPPRLKSIPMGSWAVVTRDTLAGNYALITLSTTLGEYPVALVSLPSPQAHLTGRSKGSTNT